MRLLTLMLVLSSLLFGYQKGDTIGKDMQKMLNIKDDKVYIVDFFASWCVSCKVEIPYISKVNKKIDKNKVEIIGVGTDQDIKDGQEFQKMLRDRGDLNFRVIDDPNHVITKKFNPIAMPALFYIKDKKVQKVIYGAVKNIDRVILKDLKTLE